MFGSSRSRSELYSGSVTLGSFLKNRDERKITRFRYDGAALEPRYVPHSFTGKEPKLEVEGGKMYYGSCHCGSTRLALKEKKLVRDEVDVQECNCSICYSVSIPC